MAAVLPFKLASRDDACASTKIARVDRDDVVVVIVLIAGWLAATVWLWGSIARSHVG